MTLHTDAEFEILRKAFHMWQETAGIWEARAVKAEAALAASNQEAWVAALLNAPNPEQIVAVPTRREQIARVLYECEKRRATNADSVLHAIAPRASHALAMEPWDECKDAFLSDADAVLAAFAAPPEQPAARDNKQHDAHMWRRKYIAEQPAPVKLEAWIRDNFAGHGRALRLQSDPPLEGEPWMSMDEAKELTRQAVALFGRESFGSPVWPRHTSDDLDIEPLIERFTGNYGETGA